MVAALRDGGFITTWDFWQGDGSGGAVFGQVLDESGDKVGDSFLVNNTTSLDQGFAQVLALPDGGFLVLWVTLHTAVLGRLYDSAGRPPGNEFRRW